MQVSRLESGALSIEPQSLDARQLVAGSVEKLASAAGAKQIRVEVQIPPETPPVLGDPERMDQVLLNLLGNAIKFSASKRNIRISVEHTQNDHTVHFAIADKGPGIPESEQPYVFKKYYRAKNVRNHMDGVGLGLSITKSIVEAHRGQIWFSSTLDQGSTFFFSLPTAQPLDAADTVVDTPRAEA
jgi:signal transduction histidine kinase